MSSAHFPKNTRLHVLSMEKFLILTLFASIQYPESEKHFQGSEMCAIDFPHKVTPREITSKKSFKNFLKKIHVK